MMRCNTSVNTENVKHSFKSTKSSPDCPLQPSMLEIDVTYLNEQCSKYVLYVYLLGVHIQTVVDMKGCKTSFCIHLLIPGYCSGLQGGMHQSDRCYLFKGSTVETNNIQNVLCSAIHFKIILDIKISTICFTSTCSCPDCLQLLHRSSTSMLALLD